MWKKIAPLLVVLSVGLNVAVASIWAAGVIQQHWSGSDHSRAPAGSEVIWCPLHRELGVSQDQWKRIEPELVKFRRSAQAVCTEVNRKRGELLDLLASPQPGRQAIAAKQEDILAGQRRMQQLVIAQLLAEKKVLTPPQQKQLFELLRQRSGCTGRPMMEMSGPGTNPPFVASKPSQ